MREEIMNWIFHGFNIVWGLLCVISWIAGVVAWVRRGFGVPRAVHVTALVLLLIGVVTTAGLFIAGIRSIGFSVFALFGFPIWAYVGWFLCGCPPEEPKEEGYDISRALSEDKK